jgi:hypothetical protein
LELASKIRLFWGILDVKTQRRAAFQGRLCGVSMTTPVREIVEVSSIGVAPPTSKIVLADFEPIASRRAQVASHLSLAIFAQRTRDDRLLFSRAHREQRNG